MLEETGPLFGVAGSFTITPATHLRVEVRGQLFLGSVDYEGQVMTGEPIATTTDYLGGELEGRLSTPLAASERWQLDGTLGVGGRWWLRDIQDVDMQARGYLESWSTLYVLLGTQATWDLVETQSIGAALDLRRPIRNEATYDFTDLGFDSDVSVNPGRATALYAELSWTRGRLMVTLYYRHLPFDRSNQVPLGSEILVWQPESEATQVGAKASVIF
ncbi:MAG: hypothetical protein O3A51_03370 [Verrucomicrobia bacterium]|nr:hypothetical protein [Verrucomicrobiota bacterium]